MNPETIVRREQAFAANLARIREFLGFDPAEAVAAGKRRGWIQDPPPVNRQDAKDAKPTKARRNYLKAAPCRDATVKSIATLGLRGPFSAQQVRYCPDVAAVGASRATVETVIRDLILQGRLRVVTAARGPRKAVYALPQ